MTPTDLVMTWLRDNADKRMVSTEAVAFGVGWPMAQTRECLEDMRRHDPLFQVDDQWVNPWSTGDPEELVADLYPDGYISWEWALARWGCLSQQPTVLTVVRAMADSRTREPVTSRWSLECVKPIPGCSPELIQLSHAGSMATAAQALVDWAYHHWLSRGESLPILESFLDDCDREVVNADLAEMAQTHPLATVRHLAETIQRHWPAGFRWPMFR